MNYGEAENIGKHNKQTKQKTLRKAKTIQIYGDIFFLFYIIICYGSFCLVVVNFISFFRNYHPDDLVEIVAKMLALVPPWVRVYRIQRDIPMPIVTSGVDNGNLRQLVLAKMKDMNVPCRDVRTR